MPQGINPDAKKQDLGINLYVPNNGTRDQSLTGIGGPRVYVRNGDYIFKKNVFLLGNHDLHILAVTILKLPF